MEFADSPKSGKLVVDANNISKTFEDKNIVNDLSIKITRGERIALVGPNGVGKTTVLNILTGSLVPDTGTVKLGVNLLSAIFDQNRSALNPNQSLWESLTEDKDLGVSGKNDQIMVRGNPKHVVGYLKEFLFDENQARGPVSVLSGGEKARLLLSRIMARESNLLVMDEPTNDLDVETLDLLQEILDGYDGTVLLVSHDRDFLDRVATTTLAFEGNGKVVAYAGGWSDYQTQKKSQNAEIRQSKNSKKNSKKHNNQSNGAKQNINITYSQLDRLSKLPDLIERTEAEITKLEEFLSQENLFIDFPEKFQKATDGLIERHEILSNLESEWIELETLNKEA